MLHSEEAIVEIFRIVKTLLETRVSQQFGNEVYEL